MPVITLTTDFGLADWYVATMKAVLLRHCPQATLVDVTHLVPPGDVLAGSIVLERALRAFAAGTVHLAVIDPGVGSRRRPLVAEVEGQLLVAPDNGLLTWPWRRLGEGAAHEITWRPAEPLSDTFHGRDLFAPVAGMLAAGAPVATVARPLASPVLLDVDLATGTVGQVIHLDHFGNATTNLPAERLSRFRAPVAEVAGATLPVRRTYADVAPGQPLALVGSSGLIELAIRGGSAASGLGLDVGDRVALREV